MKALRRAATALVVLCCVFPSASQPRTKYFPIVPGIVSNTPLVLTFRSADLNLIVSDLIMGPGAARNIPTPTRAVMELRGGGVVTIINGERMVRRQGDRWRISRGDRLSIENPFDAAVIRTMIILERGR